MYCILSGCPRAFITESQDAPNDTRLRFQIAAAIFNMTVEAHPGKNSISVIYNLSYTIQWFERRKGLFTFTLRFEMTLNQDI